MNAPAPQSHPILPVDPDNYRQDVSPRGLAVALSFCALLVGLGYSETGQRWLGVDRAAVLWVFGLYTLVYVNNVRLMRDDRLLRDGYWPFRVAGCMAAVAIAGVFGATSDHTASSALIGILFLAMAIGIAVRPTHAMLPIVLLPLVTLRWAFVPDATPLSYGVLICVGLASHLVFLRVAGLVLRERQAEVRSQAVRDLTQDDQERAAQLRVAMSLHDSLSGSLLATRRQLRSEAVDDSSLAAARHWLLRLRAVVARAFASEDEHPSQLVMRLAASLNVPLELDAPPDLQVLDGEERDDLLAILSELVANAAAHGEGKTLRIELKADERQTHIMSAMPELSGQSAGGGRGMRNISLRALRRGGQAAWKDGALSISWPRKTTMESVMWRAAAEVFLMVAGFTTMLLIIDARIAPIVVGGIIGSFLIFTIRDRFTRATRAEAELERLRQARLDAEQGQLLDLAGIALQPAVRAAEEALVAQERAALAMAFDDMAWRLKDLMWALEWRGDHEALRLDLMQMAEEVGAAPSSEVPASALHSAVERWQLVTRLREAVASVQAPAA